MWQYVYVNTRHSAQWRVLRCNKIYKTKPTCKATCNSIQTLVQDRSSLSYDKNTTPIPPHNWLLSLANSVSHEAWHAGRGHCPCLGRKHPVSMGTSIKCTYFMQLHIKHIQMTPQGTARLCQSVPARDGTIRNPLSDMRQKSWPLQKYLCLSAYDICWNIIRTTKARNI
jgi:hypothetical protein